MYIFRRIVSIIQNINLILRGKVIGKIIDPTVHFTGRKYVKIGSKTVVSERTWFNVNQRNRDNLISIGDNCFIGRNNFFTCGKRIILRDFVMTSVNCTFLGAFHDYLSPLKPYLMASVCSEHEIYIGTNVMVGANVSIVGNATIGHGSIIGANSVVSGDFQPFSLIIGNPAKVIKRYSFIDESWEMGIDPSFPTEEEYLEILSKYKGKIIAAGAAGRYFGNIYY